METSFEEARMKSEELIKDNEEQVKVKMEFHSKYVVFEGLERHQLGEAK